MKKLLLQGALLSLFTFAFVSCESDDNNEPWVEPEVTTTGVYILNSGTNNDATLSYYDIATNTLTSDVFFNKNNQKLGNQAQDMLVYGSKIYISVTNSNKIFVTDRSAKLLQTISPVNNGEDMKPRYLKAYGGKIYASAYSGHVLKIDTTTMAYDKVKVGLFPEQMTISDGKLYVANSGWGNDNTVSVVNLATFTETIKIKVTVNPDAVTSDKYGNIYVLSQGDYNTIKPTLQKINPTTTAVTIIGTDVATQMKINGDKLYLLYLDYVNPAKLSYYDIATGAFVQSSFVTPPSETALKNAYSISIEPVNGDIYITTASYAEKGGVYVFSADGKYKTNFSSEGYYPMGAFFLTETK